MAEDNTLAWWIWQRWDLLGPTVLDLVDLTLTPLEAEHLMDKLAHLHGLARRHRAAQTQGGGG